MPNRSQRRRKAILPLKVTISVGTKIHLAYTVDISASGARIVLTTQVAPGSPIALEYKHRRTTGTVVWCKPLGTSKYDHELGILLPCAGSSFWGIKLPLQEPDCSEEVAAVPFDQFIHSLSKPH